MALIRAPRQTGDFGQHLAIAPGPGQYNLVLDTKKSSSFPIRYAPFNTSTNRLLLQVKDNNEPGPGLYESKSEFDVEKRACSTANFMSRDKKIAELQLMNSPGPAAYGHVADWRRELQKRNAKTALPQARAVAYNVCPPPTAPSIPTWEQSFGYDQAKNSGTLQARAPKEKRLKKNETAGPGAYEISGNLLHESLGTSFHKSQSTRKPFKVTNEFPGPGNYIGTTAPSITGLAPQLKEHFKPTSAFASTQRRFRSFRKKIPGPGEYLCDRKPNSELFALGKIQCFGSMQKRKTDIGESTNPGPGSYNQTSQFQAIAEVQTKAAALGLDQFAPFASSATRTLGDPVQQNLNPGPGAYDSDSSSLTVNLAGRFGVFGTTSTRFIEKKGLDGPGPADYELSQKNRITYEDIRPTSQFRSKTKRFKVKHVSSQAMYNVNRQPKITTNTKNGVFVSGARRFETSQAKRKASYTPGPGAYTTNKRSSKQWVKNTYTTAFNSRTKRGHKAETFDAGPGSYNLRSGFVKKSFNITIE